MEAGAAKGDSRGSAPHGWIRCLPGRDCRLNPLGCLVFTTLTIPNNRYQRWDTRFKVGDISLHFGWRAKSSPQPADATRGGMSPPSLGTLVSLLCTITRIFFQVPEHSRLFPSCAVNTFYTFFLERLLPCCSHGWDLVELQGSCLRRNLPWTLCLSKPCFEIYQSTSFSFYAASSGWVRILICSCPCSLGLIDGKRSKG